MDGSRVGASVVLLHGIAGTRHSMARIEQALVGAGYRTLNVAYPSRRAPLEILADKVWPSILDFAARSPGVTHFVGYSLGALVVRVLLDRDRPLRLGRVVMLGPPNRGSELADRLQAWWLYRALFGPAGQELTTKAAASLAEQMRPIDYSLGIVAGTRSMPVLPAWLLPGPNDGRVTVLSTMLAGMADHVTVEGGHPRLARNPAAIAQTLAFLRQGRFERDEPTHGALDSRPVSSEVLSIAERS